MTLRFGRLEHEKIPDSCRKDHAWGINRWFIRIQFWISFTHPNLSILIFLSQVLGKFQVVLSLRSPSITERSRTAGWNKRGKNRLNPTACRRGKRAGPRLRHHQISCGIWQNSWDVIWSPGTCIKLPKLSRYWIWKIYRLRCEGILIVLVDVSDVLRTTCLGLPFIPMVRGSLDTKYWIHCWWIHGRHKTCVDAPKTQSTHSKVLFLEKECNLPRKGRDREVKRCSVPSVTPQKRHLLYPLKNTILQCFPWSTLTTFLNFWGHISLHLQVGNLNIWSF